MKILHTIVIVLRHIFQKHYPITPCGLATAKDKAYMAGYAYWTKYQADICEYCFDGLIVIRKKKAKTP